ncbi:WXG100 family type VII secretion target [Nocardioides jishulii]|uniref:ESAT-6-like protein n=1 Tax=Nocardioides jishulii TaxID=2575440 RepID=A0A4U2YTQ7_9ACTN|nr:WXG100 family type VII secretion target [Nocardioides jishulii]QCX28848.1 WXG100 family type VII secretion target [Nocardioides jishulii]TKI64255.1 WXG100 family type VII secretion target [Nocardioides jishulii]
MSQMSQGDLVVGEGVLAAASEAVTRARTDVTTLSRQLAGEIEALESRWKGDGARAFERLHHAWQSKQQRVVGALDGLAAALEETGRDAVATDSAQADVTQRLLSRLG